MEIIDPTAEVVVAAIEVAVTADTTTTDQTSEKEEEDITTIEVSQETVSWEASRADIIMEETKPTEILLS